MYIKIIFSAALLTTILIGCNQNNLKSKSDIQKPNIIFVLADDLGYNDVGYAGQEQIKTPHIDQLAKEGKVYTNAYAGAPVCGPSRSVLMTGQHTGHTTVRGNSTIVGGIPGKKGDKVVYRANLSDSDYTVGNLMQDAGYKTCLVGKWHLGGYDSTATPNHRGFDEFYGWLTNKPQTYQSTYWPHKRLKNNNMIDIPQNAEGKKGYYHTDMCTDEAIEFITQNKDCDQPFMLMLCYSNPHAPLDAPDNAIYNNKEWPDNMKTYASMIYHLDKNIERLKQTLIREGLSDNTIVFFCSDNGPRSNYSDKLTEVVDFFDSNGQLRGYKRDMYEGGIRTPMIVWSPKMIKAGSKSELPWYFADIMPTFAEISNFKTDLMKTDGISIYPSIIDNPMPNSPRFLYWEFFERGYKQAVRYGKWKAVVIGGKMELYDLSNDIGEQNNIADKHPEITNTIKEYLSECRTESPFWPVKN
ncbi:arylsulfatase [Plebeiibacterium marinum]|uniref:Arylsulfatase n=1 Tax=Plebeiibacterium marinum TaxID=2992111 RepID=A0AAE3MH42_9BACT|nr:arylsulfatase [Plebeiobacterium marinum]MCW3806942.1 arylsulfatase [Plebeiobacterium marinum]